MSVDADILNLRPMTMADLSAVLGIEQQAYSFPWSYGIFADCLKHGYSCWVYEMDQIVIAYAAVMFSLDEMHLLNICVHPQYHGQRLGSRLLKTLEAIGKGVNADTCFLEVRQSNFPAIRLYLNAGFNEVGLRKNYYQALHGREDAIVMAKTLF
jgi:ribosomal-protein-alanine N-acetyltransferase